MSAIAEVRIEKEELDAIKKSVLTSSRRLLVDSIDPANHLSYLRSKFILSEREAEEICAPPSRSARAEILLDKLGLKGSEAYDEFQNSLYRDRTQLFLLSAMTKTLELLKHRVRDFKAQQLKQQEEEQQRHQQHKAQPATHTFYHQKPPSPRPQQAPHCGQFNPAHQPRSHQRQQMTSYQPTPAQQAQRDAYCRQRLAELGQQKGYESQQSMGFSPPPQYQTHFFTPPPSHPHQYPQHHHHAPPLRQTPPNFQSRDGSTDDDLAACEEVDIPCLANEQGIPHEITSSPDLPCGQPC